MNLPASTSSSTPEQWVPPEVCTYCGAKLDPFFYFCTRCATPYKSVGSVLPALRVLPPTEGELVSKRAPHVKTVFYTYLAVVVATAVIGYVAFEEERPDVLLFFQMGALFVTTCIFAARHWVSLEVQFRRIGLFRVETLIGLAVLAPLLAVNYYYHDWLIREFGAGEGPLVRLRELGISESAIILFFCVFPAVLEEIAFRGLVQHWLQIALRPWRALLVASALFTVLHFSVVSAPYIMAVGMLLGWLKWRTGSLYPSMLLHFLHNLIVVEIFWPS